VIVVGILGSAGAMAVEIARRAAAAGARTELVGVAASGPDGDRIFIELATAGVGHATVTRSNALGIEPADLDLALRYLPDVHAIVLERPDLGLLGVALDASGWSGAALVVVGPLDRAGLEALDRATNRPLLLDPPSSDPDGAFAGLVAALAVRLDAGEPIDRAWQDTVAALALDPVQPG
jgi:hypothetical protein